MGEDCPVGKIILGEVQMVKENQNHTIRQLSNIDTRLSVLEHDVKTLSGRVNGINGCIAEEKKLKQWTRGQYLKVIGLMIGIATLVSTLVISVIAL
jgi:hypothetical protein